jgi:1-acyl-sn-glycerol-3-phosphate acyltransferase
MHPEGTRSKSTDPYALLPAEQSFGRVVLRAKPQVVPVFVNGVGNSLARECLETLRGTASPIIVVFGAPLELDQFAELEPTRLRSQVEVGQRTLTAIRDLAAEERAYRATLERS